MAKKQEKQLAVAALHMLSLIETAESWDDMLAAVKQGAGVIKKMLLDDADFKRLMATPDEG